MSPAVVAVIVGVGIVAAGSLVLARISARLRREVEAANHERDAANALKNHFVAMVSHELRTPLTSIAGFSETLLGAWRTLPADEVDEFLTHITKQAGYLGDLVEDILVIPRLEAGRLQLFPETMDVTRLVQDTTSMVFLPETGGRASVSIPGGVEAWGDPRRAQQVVRNLLENARKYGGDQVLVEGFSYGDHFVVVVSDNGSGVPPGAVDIIFEHFEQLSKGDSRSSSGVGLGLPIARRLARAMGGDVWYERRFPTGSRFCFSIPVSEEAHTRIVVRRELEEAEGVGATR